jgi:AcrR family transcriptional regulator
MQYDDFLLNNADVLSAVPGGFGPIRPALAARRDRTLDTADTVRSCPAMDTRTDRLEGRSAGAVAESRTRRRLPAAQREQMILEAAIDFFAEHGFEAQIRQLADHIGVSQALIFRYFASKEELVERVYHRTFLARWDPSWESMLADRAIPLRTRLRRLLKSYLSVVDDRRWIRISMHASLAGHDLTRRYVQIYVTNLLKSVAREVRAHRGEALEPDYTPAEMERVWHLHSTVVYYLVRKHVHGTPVPLDTEMVVTVAVDTFMQGIGAQAADAAMTGLAPDAVPVARKAKA